MATLTSSPQHHNVNEAVKEKNAEQGQQHHDHNQYTFSQNWFNLIRHEWEARTRSLRGGKLSVLEIGSFEGQSTTWILDNLMDHDESTMIAVDTFAGGMEHQQNGSTHDSYRLSTLEERFRSNVSKSKNGDKVTVMKMRSDDALLALRQKCLQFDFIYIDGSHVAIDVLHDAVVCWRMLNVSGVMVFDDFSWKGYMQDCYNPRIAIEAFLRCAEPEIEFEETESQMWIKRVPNKIQATPNPDPDLYYWHRGLAKKS